MTIEEKAEKLLELLAKKGYAHLGFLYEEVDSSAQSHIDYVVVKDSLLSEGLIDPTNQKDTYSITRKGRRVIDSGGYKKYMEDQRIEEAEELKHKKNKRKKDYYLSMLAPWQVYLFWPIFVIGVLGTIVNGVKVWDLFQSPQTESLDKEKPEELDAKTLIVSPLIDSVKAE